MPRNRAGYSIGILLGISILAAGPVSRAVCQPLAPAAPARYDVRIRYRINAARNQRIAQFFAMVRYFESIGFHKDPGPEQEPEDPTETLITGSIASTNARR